MHLYAPCAEMIHSISGHLYANRNRCWWSVGHLGKMGSKAPNPRRMQRTGPSWAESVRRISAFFNQFSQNYFYTTSIQILAVFINLNFQVHILSHLYENTLMHSQFFLKSLYFKHALQANFQKYSNTWFKIKDWLKYN